MKWTILLFCLLFFSCATRPQNRYSVYSAKGTEKNRNKNTVMAGIPSERIMKQKKQLKISVTAEPGAEHPVVSWFLYPWSHKGKEPVSGEKFYISKIRLPLPDPIGYNLYSEINRTQASAKRIILIEPAVIHRRLKTKIKAKRIVQAPKKETKTDKIVIFRHIVSRPKDSIIISFTGRGWLYKGLVNNKNSKNNKSGIKAIQYGGKEYNNEKTTFNFKASALGNYDIEFIKQDNSSGKNESRIVQLKVVPEADFDKYLAEAKNTDRIKRSKLDPDISAADNLYKMGSYRAALNEYLKVYDSNNSYLNQKIADIYFNEKEYDAALKYWEHNLDKKNIYYSEALAGTMMSAAAVDDIARIFEYLESFEKLPENNAETDNQIKKEEAVFFTAGELYKHGRIKFALKLFDNYIRNYPAGEQLDAVYFYLGKIYEEAADVRNLKKSLYYYGKVYNNYSGSSYYLAAGKRIRYIKRHFFDIR
ncbi:MAG: hypothetical protein GXP33_13395 [Spirochaetes bacterium]|nr:hypothetical protein [Spirochaetota bacterium]